MEGRPEDRVHQLLQPAAKKLKVARVRYPNWEKQETLILVKSNQRQIEEFAMATSKGRAAAANEQKWERISYLCSREGVSRDAEQCRKRWQDLSKNYKRIKEWDGAAIEVPCFWLMSSSRRKANNLPGNFDKDVFNYMDLFMGTKAAAKQPLSPDGNQELVDGCLDSGRASMEALQSEPHGDTSSQEDSRVLPNQRVMASRDCRKHLPSCQPDIGNDCGYLISEAVESAVRLAQEQFSAQLTEILADVLLQVSNAMKTVAENIRKRPR